jgi:hypothetical protein
MALIYTVTDWLGHALYSFATEPEASEYIQRYDPHPGTMAGMRIEWYERRPYHAVSELLPEPIGNRAVRPVVEG